MTSKAKLPKGLTFEKALERLEKIVAELEDPERGLEASLARFEAFDQPPPYRSRSSRKGSHSRASAAASSRRSRNGSTSS